MFLFLNKRKERLRSYGDEEFCGSEGEREKAAK